MDVGIEIKSEKLLKKKEKTMYLIFNSTKMRDDAYNSIYKSLPKPDDCITTEKDIMEYAL